MPRPTTFEPVNDTAARLFATSDIVSLCMPLVPVTRGMVGEAELRSVRPESFPVNTSRALLIDQDALRTAIDGEWLAGVALDVFEIEPIPTGHWLLTAPRTLLSPHMGYVSDVNYRTYFADVVANIAAYRAGEPVRVLGS